MADGVVAKNERVLDAVSLSVFALLGLGVLLRLMQYLGDTSLWLDEAMLSLSVVSRPLRELLTQPLHRDQSAPGGVLLLMHAAYRLFGSSDLALRLPQFMGGITTLFVGYALARRVLRRSAWPVAVALITFAGPLIHFSGLTKQYAIDAALAPALVLLALHAARLPRLAWRDALLMMAAGALAPWFSHPAILVLVGVSGGLLLVAWQERMGLRRQDLARLGLVIASWASSAFFATRWAESMISDERRAFLQTWWSPGFMPLPPWRPEALLWPLKAFVRIFGGVESAGLWYPLKYGFAGLAVLGTLSLVRRSRGDATILTLPLLLTLLAGIAQKYPFYDRLLLFLVPGLLVALAEGIDVVGRAAARLTPAAGPGALVLLSALACYPVLGALPPYQVEHIKPVLAHIRAHSGDADRLYVYGETREAFQYYAPRYRFAAAAYTFGAHPYAAQRQHLQELDRFRGSSRVWLVVSHVFPTCHDVDDMLAYLDRIGVRRDEVLVPAHLPAGSLQWEISASAYAYDLSDPERLARADAASFPIATSADGGLHPGCD